MKFSILATVAAIGAISTASAVPERELKNQNQKNQKKNKQQKNNWGNPNMLQPPQHQPEPKPVNTKAPTYAPTVAGKGGQGQGTCLSSDELKRNALQIKYDFNGDYTLCEYGAALVFPEFSQNDNMLPIVGVNMGKPFFNAEDMSDPANLKSLPGIQGGAQDIISAFQLTLPATIGPFGCNGQTGPNVPGNAAAGCPGGTNTPFEFVGTYSSITDKFRFVSLNSLSETIDDGNINAQLNIAVELECFPRKDGAGYPEGSLYCESTLQLTKVFGQDTFPIPFILQSASFHFTLVPHKTNFVNYYRCPCVDQQETFDTDFGTNGGFIPDSVQRPNSIPGGNGVQDFPNNN